MSYTPNDPDAVIPTRHFCDGCKQGTTSKLDCANLQKVVCFTCPRRDHFSGDCDNLIRKSNPPSSVPAFWSSLPLRRLFPTISTRSSTTGLRTQSTDGVNATPCESEEYNERKDVEIQLLDWQGRCNDALRLLRACDRQDTADALELQRPEPRGWREPSGKEYTHVHEYEKVANIFSDQVLVTRDSSLRLTRRKQHLNATKKYCLAIFHKLEAFGLAEAAMDPLARWHIDPKSSAIESESQKILSHIPTSAPSTAGSMANFVDLMHRHITHLYEMPGDTLYSRYTIAFKMIQTAVRWKFTGTTFMQNSVHTSIISPAEITRLFRPLDTQFKGILEEGLMRKGGLPWDQALCFLETHGVERLYASSWRWLRELFHYEDVSQKYVPLTIIKGAGHEYIPIPEGESAIVADFHSIRTQTTDSPTYLTSGFYRIKAGPTRNIPTYDYEETKYVLNGQIDVLDEATGVTHHLVAGDFAFFHVGSKAQFSSKSGGTAFFAVTRPVITQHPGLKGREEKVLSKL